MNRPLPAPTSPAGRRRLAACALLAVPLLGGCSTLNAINPFGSSDSKDQAKLIDLSTEPPDRLYTNGIEALNAERYKVAVQHFEAIQQNYPYSPWTTNAQLMEGYTEYKQSDYTEATGQLDRFIQLHPTSKDAAYAYYLRSLCYYEQIADIQRDQKSTQEAMAALQEVVNRFPDSAYGRDARLKIDLCRDHLAGKEMLVGRYYEQQHLYVAAVNRYQRVVQDFQTTNHAAEALHRLVEVYLKLGLTDQARKTAAVLGYNYPGSSWYQDSYADLRSAGALSPGDASRTPAPAGKPGFFSRIF